ncbi:MAG: hypothetical protein K0M63_06555 [Weeksellaceae bacterium]|nr:hypothetical protein [Weeksellaceae bacterium]
MIYIKTILLAATALVAIQCDAQKKANEKNSTVQTATASKMNIQKIELEEMTRGSRRMVTITPTVKMVEINGTKTEMKTGTTEWNTLMKLIPSQDLNKLASYPSPTTKRYHDGALSADLKITVGGKTFSSQSFDSGVPPKPISDLYFEVTKNFKAR